MSQWPGRSSTIRDRFPVVEHCRSIELNTFFLQSIPPWGEALQPLNGGPCHSGHESLPRLFCFPDLCVQEGFAIADLLDWGRVIYAAEAGVWARWVTAGKTYQVSGGWLNDRLAGKQVGWKTDKLAFTFPQMKFEKSLQAVRNTLCRALQQPEKNMSQNFETLLSKVVSTEFCWLEHAIGISIAEAAQFMIIEICAHLSSKLASSGDQIFILKKLSVQANLGKGLAIPVARPCNLFWVDSLFNLSFKVVKIYCANSYLVPWIPKCDMPTS